MPAGSLLLQRIVSLLPFTFQSRLEWDSADSSDPKWFAFALGFTNFTPNTGEQNSIMTNIFIIGAGRSATTMIKYLLDHAEAGDWQVTVADRLEDLAKEKVGEHPRGRAIFFDVTDAEQCEAEMKDADLVISLLPPHMHVIPAKFCLKHNTHMVTASYVSDGMKAMDEQARAKGLLFLNEIGADPGIDHMSAMEMIDRIKEQGGSIHSFRSYCGAIVAPESSNLWGYKFTWAPRNIVLAGTGGVAKYRRNGKTKYLPYHHIFRRTETISIPNYGEFEAYANRDSVSYAPIYGLDEVPTLLRATLRHPGYCEMWQAIIDLGLTDDSYRIPESEGMTYRDLVFSYVNEIPGVTDTEALAFFLDLPANGVVMEKLLALGLLSDERIPLKNATPAQIMEHILMQRWVFEEDDTDMLVMQHQIEYDLDGVRRKLVSSMVDKGRDHDHTAISRTVGLPAAIAARMILEGKIKSTGVQIPIQRDIYEPILKELENYDIRFVEETFLAEPESV
jgi:saccharopine dehydrogenase-like NADP-dependent oxidoreductase